MEPRNYKRDVDLIKKICSLRQVSLMKTLGKLLFKKYNKNVVVTSDYIYAVGNIPVALVAHMDTVFDNPPIDIYYDQEKATMWSPDGLGADDRAGIYAIISIINRGYLPSVIFTTNEELGGLGASEFAHRERKAFKHLKYIIELDRAGKNDCVFYNSFNTKFMEYVESFGFKTAIGSFSDISCICPEFDIAGVNLSVGYSQEHSYSEHLNLIALNDTIDKVINMLDDINHVKKPFRYCGRYKTPYSYGFNEDFYPSNYKCRCSKCNKEYYDYEIFWVKGLNDQVQTYCPECIIDNVEWCEKCGRPFEIPDNCTVRICKDCSKKARNGVTSINGVQS